MKKSFKSKKSTNNGITLIALVITIIVLLILAGVSIATLTGENGVVQKAQNAKEITQINGEIEKIELAVSETQLEKVESNREEMILKEEIEEMFDENINLGSLQEDGTRLVIVENKTYSINKSEVVYLEPKIRDKESIIVSSIDKIVFKNTITKDDIKADYPNYKTYEMVGISNSEDGEYVKTGSISGKAGTLEILGDINDTTFEYKLNKVMLGDETFFAKVIIDGSEVIQKIKVIQGEVVRYEEDIFDFVDSTAATETYGKWVDIEGSQFSNGKAKKIESDSATGRPSVAAEFSTEVVGSKFDILWGQSEKASGTLAFYLFDEGGIQLYSYIKAFDLFEEGYVISTLFDENEMDGIQKYSIKTQVAYLFSLDSEGTGESTIIIDGIEVWR